MMKLVILALCFVEVLTSEGFIQTTNGQTNVIMCEENSTFFTNDSRYWECNNKTCCALIETDPVSYVCLKSKTNCLLWDSSLSIPEKGCIYTYGFEEIAFTFTPSKKYHLFVLLGKVHSINKNETHSIFSSFTCEKCELKIYSESMILLKVSTETQADFEEFFIVNSSTIPQGGKGTEKDVECHSTTVAPTETRKNKKENNNRKQRRKERKKERKNINVFIILGAVMIVLLIIIFLMAAFIFYRLRTSKRTQNTEIANEIYVGEDGTIGRTPERAVPCDKFNDRMEMIVENEFYEAAASEDRSQLKAQNTEYAEISFDVYAEVNKPKKGNNDVPIDPGDSSHVEVNGDLYAVVNKEGAG